MRGAFEPWHILILVVVLLVLFGGKKLPEAARGLGRSLRIFKSEVKEMRDDDKPNPPTGPLEGRVVGADQPVVPAATPAPVQAPVQAPKTVREPEPVPLPDERRPGL